MLCNVSVKRVIGVVNALVNLQIFCIDESGTDEVTPELLARDHNNLITNADSYVELESNEEHVNLLYQWL